MILNLYDFDKTIYDGDSTLDFYRFCLKKDKKLLRFLPQQIKGLIGYATGVYSKEKYKSLFFSFFRGIDNVDKRVDEFWVISKKKIKQWYKNDLAPHKVIISASPEFLLRPVAGEINSMRIIASPVVKRTGEFKGLNCYGAEKVRRLEESYPHSFIQNTYSDSLSDLPMLKLAQNPYIVKGDRIIKLNDYDRLPIIQYFFSRKFIAFLIVGMINAILGVFLSYLFFILLQNTILALICGFLTSLVPSYFLNSTFTFREKNYSFRYFYKFCLSYIPNLLIQVISVSILDKLYGDSKILLYIASVSISVPVTFLILTIFTFKHKVQER